MSTMSQVYTIIFLTLFLSLFCTTIGENNLDNNQEETQAYIVSVRNDLKPLHFSNVEDWYNSILSRSNSNPSDIMLHVYKTVFHGFSARLSSDQANSLRSQVEVIQIFPDVTYQLYTTRTPHFLDLNTYNRPQGLLNDSNLGSNVVVGVLDTGIWPEIPSFNDEGMDPVPPHFKGVCEGGEKFPPSLCNKKIVGVRYFASTRSKTDQNSARDEVGHGTHTASTIAGRTLTKNASFFGYAKGEARGIAPKARLAIYKVCWGIFCMSSDVLAGIDKAVEDGVDVISLSLGGLPSRYNNDPIALGSFGAFQKGVFVSAAVGNSGPTPGSLSNVAPWMTAVGASTIDRTFPADVILDNGEVLSGSSLFTGDPLPNNKTFPLINFRSNYSMDHCMPGSLDRVNVKGKIVICSSGSNVEEGVVVKLAGGKGVIIAMNDPTIDANDTVVSDPFMMPGLTIPFFETERLLDYMRKKQVKRGTIVSRGTRYGQKPAPMVASFSSRGPNRLSKYVLKPDVIAPGVDILAGWPNNIPLTGLEVDPRRSDFNIMSGTSMSCPHVSGLAALLKNAHPDWTPAMIRSAIMTTAYTGYHHETKRTTQNGHQVSYWVGGAGHVNPEKANDPGLVYDLTEEDYIQFLCASNYNVTEIQIMVKRPVSCHDKMKVNQWDLNYPALVMPAGKMAVRTLTNVESSAATYIAQVEHPKGVSVSVSPLKLSFKAINVTRKYSVKVSAMKGFMQNEDAMGSITWTYGNHHVTIPLIVVV